MLERSSPTLYRPDGYVAFDAIVSWSPRWVPGLTLRASVLNFTDARYFRSLNGTTTYDIVPTTAVAISQSARAADRARANLQGWRDLSRSEASTTPLNAMNRMHARIRFNAFS